ncbi:hypothetical protein PFISCL1PPCAC_7743, partial [Pristionchus fissidentatus]
APAANTAQTAGSSNSSSATITAAPEALSTPPQQQKSIPAPSKMIKLFGKEKKKEEETKTPLTSKKSTTTMKKAGLRPPSDRVVEKKPEVVATRMNLATKMEIEEEKRISKTSVDSAFGELSASSSSPSNSSTSSTADVSQTMIQISPLSDQSSMPIYSPSSSSFPVPSQSRLHPPKRSVAAAAANGVTAAAASAAAPECPTPSPIAEKPTLAVKGRPMRAVNAEPEVAEIDSPTIVEEIDEIKSIIGDEKKINNSSTANEAEKESTKSIPLPSARAETTFTPSPIPLPPPAVTATTTMNRQLPSYSQLYTSGRISAPIVESSPEGRQSPEVVVAAPDMFRRGAAPPHPHPQRTRHSNDGLFYTKTSMMLQDDSSDSSSISSTSDDFCESSSIISGTQSDCSRMAAAAYAFSRGSQQQQRNGRSSSMGERHRHFVDQENISALLKQCKTSRRSEAYQQHQWQFGQEGTPIDLPPRLNGLTSNGYTGLHSLERKSRVAHLYDQQGIDRSALSALVSPRRMPLPSASSSDRHSLSGSLKRNGHEGIYANVAALRDGDLSVHKSSLPCSPSHSLRQSTDRDFKGSQLSLASSCAFSTVDNIEVDRLVRDLEGYQRKVNSLQRSNHNYESVMETVKRRVERIGRAVEKHEDMTSSEASRLRADIDAILLVCARGNSGGIRVTEPVQIDGLTRQPSLESVASSMSTTSKTSVLGFGAKGQKKSWVRRLFQFRSSLTKAFHKNGSKKEKKEENKEVEQPAVANLKKQLADKECTLYDVRLDAVTSANEVQILKETVHKLKSENQQLRSEMRSITSGRSRASSRASIPVDDDVCYDIPPSSSRSSASSKRSSGCSAVRVSVNVDLHGTLTSTVSPDNEISIGFLPLPGHDVSWSQLDAQLFALFQEYLNRIDPENTLGLHAAKSVIGYQIGEVCRYLNNKALPSSAPFESIITASTIRIFLRGAAQSEVDSLVLGSLFPRKIIDTVLKDLNTSRRLLLCGATGIGKSMLARQLASLLSARLGLKEDGIHEIRMTEDAASGAQAQLQLDRLLLSSNPSVILIDNVPRSRVALISSSILSANIAPNHGPYVICTVNRACQLPETVTTQAFKTFIVTSRHEGVKGFTARFLRRRLVEQEYRSCSTVPSEMLAIIDFMTTVLTAVNAFIEKANSLDVTIGPRTLCACPLEIDESRAWFVQLWNENLVPYMAKVANEGVKVLGRCGSFEDPTDTVCDAWPWEEGAAGRDVLHRLSSFSQIHQKTEKPTNFNALDALMKIRNREAET